MRDLAPSFCRRRSPPSVSSSTGISRQYMAQLQVEGNWNSQLILVRFLLRHHTTIPRLVR